jgi:hypothetical protein
MLVLWSLEKQKAVATVKVSFAGGAAYQVFKWFIIYKLLIRNSITWHQFLEVYVDYWKYHVEALVWGPLSHTRLRARDHLHFKESHWWKRWSQSKFASHYAWGHLVLHLKTMWDQKAGHYILDDEKQLSLKKLNETFKKLMTTWPLKQTIWTNSKLRWHYLEAYS